MIQKLCSFFKVLGDETRCTIFSLLLSGEMSVGEIASRLGQTQSLVSHHLYHLKVSGLVKTRRDGVWIYYSVDKKTLQRFISRLLKELDKSEIDLVKEA